MHLCISCGWQYAVQNALDTLHVESRIRVSKTTNPAELLAGSVSSIGPNAVLLYPSAEDSVSGAVERWVLFDAVSEMALSRGIQDRSTAGLRTGGIAGALGGTALGALTSGYSCEVLPDPVLVVNNRPALTRQCTGAPPGERAAIVGFVSGILGGALGDFIGPRMLAERWMSAGPTWTPVRF